MVIYKIYEKIIIYNAYFIVCVTNIDFRLCSNKILNNERDILNYISGWKIIVGSIELG